MQKESICELLYEGQLDLSRAAVINNPQYTKAYAEYCKSVDRLYENLDDEQKKLYDDISDKLVDREDSLIYRAFRTGMKFAFELLDDIRDIPLEFKTN